MDNDLNDLQAHFIVQGMPMTTASKLMAAMVIRLGGRVEITATEIEAAQGLMFTPGEKGCVVEANTDPSFSVLDETIIE